MNPKWLFKSMLFLGLCLLTIGTLHAGDTAALRIIGFSAEGRYLAFEVSGVQDGSGIPYCEIYIVDVPRNAFAVRPLRRQGPEPEKNGPTLAAFRAQVRSEAEAALQQFDIDERNKGTSLVYHPLSDATTHGYRVAFTLHEPFYATPPEYLYELCLEEQATGEQCFGFTAKIFTLKLKNQEQEKTLQADTRLPASRGCVYKYRIERVLKYKNGLVVFINLFKPGFEGPDLRYMAVTGTLDF